MSTDPPRLYLPASALAVLTSALVLGVADGPALAAPVAGSAATHMQMPMGSSTPEHVADALAALEMGHLSDARADLRLAVKTHGEPAHARMHAKEALTALKTDDRAMAKMHATNGAAVEHLTYALRSLKAGQTMTARAHLREAAALPKVRAHANAALAAIKRGDRRAARHDIAAGLKAANRE